MVGCVLNQLKPSDLYILCCEKGLSLRPPPFPQLRMRAPRALSYTESMFSMHGYGYGILCPAGIVHSGS